MAKRFSMSIDQFKVKVFPSTATPGEFAWTVDSGTTVNPCVVARGTDAPVELALATACYMAGRHAEEN